VCVVRFDSEFPFVDMKRTAALTAQSHGDRFAALLQNGQQLSDLFSGLLGVIQQSRRGSAMLIRRGGNRNFAHRPLYTKRGRIRTPELCRRYL
jgi:hypothetical protein